MLILIYYLLAGALVFLSYKSFRGGMSYLRFFRREIGKRRPDFTPFATLIVPCRGVDDGLAENLLALVNQDYPEYEVIFVVDDVGDPAVRVIREITDRENRAQMVVAPKARASGQKVENLREAVKHISSSSQVLVFADSDARPSPDWLRHLVAPLESVTVGAASGYRWYVSPQPSLGSELRSAWNASIATALGPNTKSNFCWGGSMAIRRDVFERLDIRDKWRGTLSDDFIVTREMQAARLPIVFVPQALTATIENCSLAEMVEFTTRQMKITRVYAPKLWLMSLVGSGLFVTVMIGSILIVLLSPRNDLTVLIAVTTIMLVTVFSIGKSWLRLRAVKFVLSQHEPALGRQFFAQNSLWLVTPIIFLYNCVGAWVSRRLKWRGITYELKSPHETVIISD